MSGTQIVGHDIDLMTFIADQISATVEYSIVTEWDLIFQGVIAGNHDLVISSVSITPWRDQLIDYTLPYAMFAVNDNVAIVVQQGDDGLRRQLNEALVQLRTDGTLASIIADIAVDRPEWQPSLPNWPYIAADVESTVVYTYPDQCPTIIQIPPGAVTETVLLALSAAPTATAPLGFSFAGKAFELEAYQTGAFAADFAFSVPVTVTIHYTETDVLGMDETTLSLYYWNSDAGMWTDAATTCGPPSPYHLNIEENWLTARICHLSKFALFARSGHYRIYLPLVVGS